jgi:UDP-perosamine 4-acetyltransferase
MNNEVNPLVLLGAGGHAKVLAALARVAGFQILGVCDPVLAAECVRDWEGLEVLGDDGAIESLSPDRVSLILGIGQLVSGNIRERLYSSWRERGFAFPSLVHPFAWVAADAKLGPGVQVMAGAVIQPGCKVDENSIINTRATVDHDCCVGRNVHVAPGSTLCGSVRVYNNAFIGAGSTVVQGVSIGEGAVVGAGVTVVKNLAANRTIIGATNRYR